MLAPASFLQVETGVLQIKMSQCEKEKKMQ